MGPDREFIEKKLSAVQDYYSELLEVLAYDTKEIISNRILLRALERLIQLLVDEILDVNKHIIKTMHLKVPDDSQSTFYTLSDSGILEKGFSHKLAPVAGLRNRLVHRYEKVEITTLIGYVRKNLEDFKEYVREIQDFLDKQKTGGK